MEVVIRVSHVVLKGILSWGTQYPTPLSALDIIEALGLLAGLKHVNVYAGKR